MHLGCCFILPLKPEIILELTHGEKLYIHLLFSATPKHFAPDITHLQIMYGILGVDIFCSKSLASSGRRSLRLLRSCWHLVVVLQTTSAAMATTS